MIAMFMPGPAEVVLLAVMVGVLVFPFWKIASKAGFPGWISLAVLVPLLNIGLLFFLALAPWPALQQSERDEMRDD